MTQDLHKGAELADRYTAGSRTGPRCTYANLVSQRSYDESFSCAEDTAKVQSCQKTSCARSWQTSIRLLHPHIVRVFEFHDESAAAFYSMQFVDGSDVSVVSGAPLADCVPVVALVAGALQYAHGKGVVHRDIKASNVLLDQNGAPYLADFGSAAAVAAMASGGSLIAATPQSLAGEPAQPTDDIFALGGLIYELVAGRAPYSSENLRDDIAMTIPGELRAASGEQVPAELAQLVARMLEKDAAARPDAEEVVTTLAAAGFAAAPAPAKYVATNTAVTAQTVTASDSVTPRKPATRMPAPQHDHQSGISPKMLGAGLAVLVVLLIGVVFVLPGTVSVDDGSDDTVAEVSAGAEANKANEEADGATEGAASDGTPPERDARVVARSETEEILGRLLSMMNTLEQRAVPRWGGLRYRQAQEVLRRSRRSLLGTRLCNRQWEIPRDDRDRRTSARRS